MTRRCKCDLCGREYDAQIHEIGGQFLPMYDDREIRLVDVIGDGIKNVYDYRICKDCADKFMKALTGLKRNRRKQEGRK